ncbi:hypothetical protein N7474_007584 [Penicillium riverlandense]|uniref:uncharacterized protein n=1 Tax=Penicillium riverlandense TaxID=1903569 RepID=UPI0025499076|nr:uncharacterized protein N7474_007584 [Penicillium riverlandense]KAJ5811283.1 hypothetical protein N7474_007584 [Penicillium riverlandense]
MLFKSALFLALSNGLAAFARPSGGWSNEPCQQITRMYQSNLTTYPGDVAQQCLVSIPFQPQRSVAFLEDLRKYLQWQSTIDVLKNPPTSYLSPATDIFGGMDQLLEMAAREVFTSQYEFDTLVTELLASAQDGHLYVSPCSTSIFEFSIDFPLVSVSSDGLELPKIYAMNDSALLSTHPERVSNLVSVNGEQAEEFFGKFALRIGGFQDPDARYNYVFNSNARLMGSDTNAGSWMNPGSWPGAGMFELRFANGTVRYAHTTAGMGYLPEFNFTTGQSMYQQLCIEPLIREANWATASASSATWMSYPSSTSIPYPSSTFISTPSATATATPSRSWTSSVTPTSSASVAPVQPYPKVYPKPVVGDDLDHIYGYYLPEKDLRTVAVLQLPTFEMYGTYAMTIPQFLKEAKAAGKQKIIIDMSNNPGGEIAAALDMFKMFFPDKPAYSATRFRAHEAMNYIGQAFGSIVQNNSNIWSWDSFEQWMPSGYVTPNQKHGFSSWKQIFGPVFELGSNMSTMHGVFNETFESATLTPINGYNGVPLRPSHTLFAPEDILIMTDGDCSSSCTTFSELMKNLAGVKTVVFGGRPQNEPMQAIGGVKGNENLDSGIIVGLYNKANRLAESAAKAGHPILTETQRMRLKELSPANIPPLSYIAGVNYLNGYRPGQPHMPLQFIYEAADCRLFYTHENFARPATSWAAAARAVWGHGRCVASSS